MFMIVILRGSPGTTAAAVRIVNCGRLSLDRLEIAYGDGRLLLISPQDKAGFLAALRRRVPRLAP
jgi:hypothetical protein